MFDRGDHNKLTCPRGPKVHYNTSQHILLMWLYIVSHVAYTSVVLKHEHSDAVKTKDDWAQTYMWKVIISVNILLYYIRILLMGYLRSFVLLLLYVIQEKNHLYLCFIKLLKYGYNFGCVWIILILTWLYLSNVLH